MTDYSGSMSGKRPDPPERFNVEVGDMISWKEPDLSIAAIDGDWSFEEYHGIVVKINFPSRQYGNYLWDVYFYGTVTAGYDEYGYQYEERDDVSWLKIMVVDSNGRKSFRYISTDDEYKIFSKAKRNLKGELSGSIIV